MTFLAGLACGALVMLAGLLVFSFCFAAGNADERALIDESLRRHERHDAPPSSNLDELTHSAHFDEKLNSNEADPIHRAAQFTAPVPSSEPPYDAMWAAINRKRRPFPKSPRQLS